MKLIATFCLAWSVFYAADALMCHTCVDNTDIQCSIQTLENCTGDEVCLVARLESNVGPRIIRKLCIPPDRCGKNEMNKVFPNLHTNLGQGNGIIAGHCCDTHDGCNLEIPDVIENVVELEPNGLRCFTCNGPFDLTCHRTFECMGMRTRCVTGMVITPDNRFQRATGCVSPNWCEGINLHLKFFSPLITLSTFVEGPFCCDDQDFCNGNRSVLPPELLAATIRPPRVAQTVTSAAGTPSVLSGPLMMLWLLCVFTRVGIL